MATARCGKAATSSFHLAAFGGALEGQVLNRFALLVSDPHILVVLGPIQAGEVGDAFPVNSIDSAEKPPLFRSQLKATQSVRKFYALISFIARFDGWGIHPRWSFSRLIFDQRGFSGESSISTPEQVVNTSQGGGLGNLNRAMADRK